MKRIHQFIDESGHLGDEGVALYVDALKLDTVDQLPEQISAHVAGCDECKTRVTGVFALVRKEDYSAVRRHPYFRLSAADTRVGGMRVWRTAAVFAAVIVVSAFAYYVVFQRSGAFHPPGVLPLAQSQADTTAVTRPAPVNPDVSLQGDYAANFQANPEYEQLVAAGQRSASLTDVVPKNDAVLPPSKLRFAWTATGGKQLTLVIMNSGGHDVYRAGIGALPYTPKKQMQPGLYYWKVIDEQEAVYFGKFTVRDIPHRPMSTNPAQK